MSSYVHLLEEEELRTPQEIDAILSDKFDLPHLSYSLSYEAMGHLIEALKTRWWWEGKANFLPESDYPAHAGFTQTGCSGWNGAPDYRGQARTVPMATALAALAIDLTDGA